MVEVGRNLKWMVLKIIFLLINTGLTFWLFFKNENSLGVFSGTLILYQIYIYVSLKYMKNNTHFTKRGKIASMVLTFVLVAIFSRLVNIQVVKRDEYSKAVNKQVEGVDRKTGKRGEIYDLNGKKLAYNANSYELGLEPKRFVDDENAVEILKKLKDEGYIEIDVERLSADIPRLADKNVRYKIVEKKIEELKKNKMETIIKEAKLKRGVLFFSKIPERRYYKNSVYKNIVGNIGYAKDETGENKIGVLGIEKQYNSYLKEKKIFMKQFFTKAREIKLPTNMEKFEISPNGKNVYLTIDYEINDILNLEMEKQFKATGSEEAHGIVMDPRTGRIIALSSFSKVRKNTRNSLIQDQFEPGSTFKPIIVAAAMEAGYISERSQFDVKDGTIRKYNKTIKESSRSTRGIISTEEVLKKSSNVGMVLIGDYFTEEKFEVWLKKFGLYERTGIDFPNELKPFSPSYKKWDKLKKSTMSFGQGIVMTPIQLATAFSAVINGGILYRPYLVDRVENQEGEVIRRNLPKEVRRVVSPQVSEKVKLMLENTVAHGTGKRAIVDGYRVGGKTGTGQISAPTGGYYKHEYLASFIGFFPVENPQYVVLTMFLKPQGETVNQKYGGTVGAPVFGEIISGIAKSKNIYSKNVRKINLKNNLEVHPENKTIEISEEMGEIMPDLKGLPSKDVLDIFHGSRFKINISGRGMVQNQIPEAGTNLYEYDVIQIKLKDGGASKK
ncbi:MAG: penicillin-binding transpeptidase domain-containing protein [Fusobacteriaceae bacterium]